MEMGEEIWEAITELQPTADQLHIDVLIDVGKEPGEKKEVVYCLRRAEIIQLLLSGETKRPNRRIDHKRSSGVYQLHH